MKTFPYLMTMYSRAHHRCVNGAIMITRISCIVLFSMFLPAYGSAQPTPSEGERVRIHQVNGTVVTGTVQAVSPQAVRLLGTTGGAEWEIAQDQIRQIERSLGLHRKFWRNFGITVAVSAVGFGALAAVSWSPCTPTEFFGCGMHESSRGEAFQVGLVGGAIIGVPIGLIVGLAVKKERWEPLSLSGQGQDRFSIRPILGRELGLSASFAFGNR